MHMEPLCNLGDALSNYFEPFEVSGSCACGNIRRAQYGFVLPPKVLMIRIKRFAYDAKFQTYKKLNFNLDCPELLDFQIETPSTYQLRAGIIHHGDTPQSGHYTAFILEGEELTHFDNSIVSKKSSHNFDLRQIYVAIYVKIEDFGQSNSSPVSEAFNVCFSPPSSPFKGFDESESASASQWLNSAPSFSSSFSTEEISKKRKSAPTKKSNEKKKARTEESEEFFLTFLNK